MPTILGMLCANLQNMKRSFEEFQGGTRRDKESTPQKSPKVSNTPGVKEKEVRQVLRGILEGSKDFNGKFDPEFYAKHKACQHKDKSCICLISRKLETFFLHLFLSRSLAPGIYRSRKH